VSDTRPAAVVVLAAGEGTRMRSATPKVLHTLCGRSLLGHVVGAVRELDPGQVAVVVGHARERVAAHLAEIAPQAQAIVQDRLGGTGHATRLALEALDASGELTGTIVVLPGDAPLLSGATLMELVHRRATSGAAVVLLTAEVPDAHGYGRVLRDASGQVLGVVEHVDATPEERLVREIATSVYAFDAAALRKALARIGTDNAQGEEYLPDVVALLVADGEGVDALVAADWRETVGINDRAQLAAARAILRDRLLADWMAAGVSIIDPLTTWLDVDVTLEPDVVIHPNTQLHGRTHVASGAEVGPNCTLRDTQVGAGAVVRDSTCESAVIGPAALVGPYSYLRPGTRLGHKAKVGGFVETKNADIGAGSKVPHLSYVGDATIGERSNVGAATVFVNYDGQDKHHTQVGDDVRIGSDTMLVAPVEIGDGAYTAAGSVITEDVPPGALGLGRAKQRNIEGWVERKRPGTPAARAAAQARKQKQDAEHQGEGATQ
jgi:bifunctional UDP-N-acetylglucosamine pyrophosphorylase/glucosamine-1-phosphate N-acetyltransferase